MLRHELVQGWPVQFFTLTKKELKMIKADKNGMKELEALANLALKQVVVQASANMRTLLKSVKALPEKKKKARK